MSYLNDHQSKPCLSLPQMKAVNNELSKEAFKEVNCVNVLGVAGLGSHKGLEVFLSDLFLSDLPDMGITQYTLEKPAKAGVV